MHPTTEVPNIQSIVNQSHRNWDRMQMRVGCDGGSGDSDFEPSCRTIKGTHAQSGLINKLTFGLDQGTTGFTHRVTVVQPEN